jgi:hypothetical protein
MTLRPRGKGQDRLGLGKWVEKQGLGPEQNSQTHPHFSL